CFDQGAVHTTIESPRLGFQSGVKCMIYFLCDQVEKLNAVHNFERKNGTIRNHDWGIVFARLSGRKRLHIDSSATIAFFPIRPVVPRSFQRNVGTVTAWSPRRCGFRLVSKNDKAPRYRCSTQSQEFPSRHFFGHYSLPLVFLRNVATRLAALLTHLR